MDWTEEIMSIIGQPENEELEYKAVLPPSRNIGQIIAALANTKGGYIILGISESSAGISINGLSEDFRANSVTHKAIDLLSPKPIVEYQYIKSKGKRLYAIKVLPSDSVVSIEGKVFVRKGINIIQTNASEQISKPNELSQIKDFKEKLKKCRLKCTGAKDNFIEHYLSVLNIFSDLGSILYPTSPNTPTDNQEGKILMRILFSSCADNFEGYLADLLFEIYLAYPATLKSTKQVTIKEVLECADMQEFIIYWSKKVWFSDKSRENNNFTIWKH